MSAFNTNDKKHVSIQHKPLATCQHSTQTISNMSAVNTNH